jgi:hypothetical protein
VAKIDIFLQKLAVRKNFTGIFYLLVIGFLGIGVIYDFWTLNDQITLLNSKRQ